VVGGAIRGEKLDVRAVDSFGADSVNFLRVAGFDDPEVVLIHALEGGIGAHLQEALLKETGVEERGDKTTMSGLVVPGSPGEEVTAVLRSAESHETGMFLLVGDGFFYPRDDDIHKSQTNQGYKCMQNESCLFYKHST